MVLKIIKNKYIAFLGLVYKLILKLVRFDHPPVVNNGMISSPQRWICDIPCGLPIEWA